MYKTEMYNEIAHIAEIRAETVKKFPGNKACNYFSSIQKHKRVGYGGVGHVCLNLNFRQISHRFTHDFTNTDKKIQKCLISFVKKYFNQKSIEVQPWTPLEVILNKFCLWITVSCMQRSRKWVLPHWIWLYLPPLGYTM